MNKKHIKIIEDYSNIKGRSLWVDARRRLFQNKAAVISLFLIFLVAFLSFFGPFFLKYSFSDTDWNSIYYPPSLNNGHFLGTGAAVERKLRRSTNINWLCVACRVTSRRTNRPKSARLPVEMYSQR